METNENQIARNETIEIELKRIRELLENEAWMLKKERKKQKFNEIYGGFFGQSIGE